MLLEAPAVNGAHAAVHAVDAQLAGADADEGAEPLVAGVQSAVLAAAAPGE